jgi:proteasome-associated ATPase
MDPVKPESELLELLSNGTAGYEQDKKAIEVVLAGYPQLAPQLCRIFLEQKHGFRKALGESEEHAAGLRAVLDKVFAPPWHSSDYLTYSTRHQRATVVNGSRKLAVAVHPSVEADVAGLKPGAEVFLNNELNAIIAVGDSFPRSGQVAAFDRWDQGRIVLKGTADQDVVASAAAGLDGVELKSGDPILFDPETRIAFERLDKKTETDYLIEDLTGTTLDQIGGLDGLVDDLLDEIDLLYFHPDLARRHRLNRARGFILSGPPGCGKTMLAKGLANYMAAYRRDGKGGAKFLSIPPGSHRSMWFGQSEAAVRKIFERAREISDREGLPTIVFFDELDNLGSRSDSHIANSIDSRIIDTFLACIDGIEEAGNVLLIGATNRPDLLDPALFRPGRFADRVFHIPRPDRFGARQIFEKHLVAGLPFRNSSGRDADQTRSEIIDAALSYIYSPRGEGNLLATLTLRDSSKRPVRATDFVSGAMIANTVREAKRRSCLRAARGLEEGIAPQDVLEAIDLEMDSVSTRLKSSRNIHGILTELPLDMDVVKVDVHTRSERPRTHEYLRHAV